MESCNPDVLDHHPMVTTKLNRLKESLYTNRAGLVDWFQDLAHSLQQSPASNVPMLVNLELHPAGNLVNWKACRFGFLVKECVNGMMQQAKRRARDYPGVIPEEGYGSGFILSVYFTNKLQEDMAFYQFYCASTLRQKHTDLVVLRRLHYESERRQRLQGSPLQYIHPLLVGPFFNQLAVNYGGGGGGGSSGTAGSGNVVIDAGAGTRPRKCMSELGKRMLCKEREESGLRCPICLEEEGMRIESCIMFMCSHYVCEVCYVGVEGGLCPLCRKQIKVASE